MRKDAERRSSMQNPKSQANAAQRRNLSRRSLLGTGALFGLAAMMATPQQAQAWSSWTNATSPILKNTGMGDCVHEDLVQICYARVVRNHANDPMPSNTLLDPWAGEIQTDARYATIAGDTVDVGKGKTFADVSDLATRLYRENLAYLRIGSFWNDAAANTLADFGFSCYHASDVPTFSGNDHYTGAWDVAQHLQETNAKNNTYFIKGRDALVQFTMNDRAGFLHGMLTGTASHKGFITQAEVKQFALQWLGVAYEYARTGQVTATSDVTYEQAETIFKGIIDTYGQLDEKAHDMSYSLKVGSKEASIKLPHRRMRLRALGMMCHTMEDLWCPAHTCRTYHADGDVPQNAILAFSNYKMQNGNKFPLFGYHIPFDRYAGSDSKNSTNWREALTRGEGAYRGSEILANALDASMDCLANADTYFNTLGMNETITCITRLLEYLYQNTPWDEGVRDWVANDIMTTFFDESGQAYVCDAGRRSLHTPTFIIAPLQSVKRAYRKVGLANNHTAALDAAKRFDAWQRGTHAFFSGTENTGQSKYVTSGKEGSNIWDDNEGENRLVDLVNKLHEGYSSLSAAKQSDLLARIGCNGCHDLVSALGLIRGMLQEFSVDLRGSLRPEGDETLVKLENVRAYFASGLKGQGSGVSAQGTEDDGLYASAEGDGEQDGTYVTSHMAIDDSLAFDDGSYLIAVRDMDSLMTSVMRVPSDTPGKERLEEGLANLTITYALETEFEHDIDYSYRVMSIDYADCEQVCLVSGTVTQVSEDGKSIVLDLNGTGDFALAFALALREGAYDVPQVGTYLCARYTVGGEVLELVGYDELDAPEGLTKVTYPVEVVTGTSVLLLTNQGESEEDGNGQRSYLEVHFGATDMRSLPQEGQLATVYYHDVAYGEVTGIDEAAFASAGYVDEGYVDESEDLYAESDEDTLTDSAVPGYAELGDEYGDLTYGNEVFHVADVVIGPDGVEPETPPTPENNEQNEPTPAPTPEPVAVTDNAQPSNTGNAQPAQAAQPQASGGKPSGTLPRTGDPFAGMSGLATAMGAAGAAMLAHSARHAADEQDDGDEGGELGE